MAEIVYDFAVIGGDMRQVYIVKELEKKGYEVAVYGAGLPDSGASLKEVIGASGHVIGPIPCSKNKKYLYAENLRVDLTMANLCEQLREGQIFLAGCIPAYMELILRDKNVRSCDLMKIEELILFNTVATAEGSIAEAIKRQPDNLHGSNSLVLGFGRCARTLALKLGAMAAGVTVAARSPADRSLAETMGFEAVSFKQLKGILKQFDYIFNTVPAMVLGREELEQAKPEVLILDIAAAPGGVDFTAARELELQAVLCSGLPGIYAPRASGKAVTDMIIRVLNLMACENEN